MLPRDTYDLGFSFENTLANRNSYSRGSESNPLSGIIKYPVATIADLGVSIYNSVVPQSIETDQLSVLESIDSSLGKYYLDHKDSIQFGSFLGGILLPGGLLTKAAKLSSLGGTAGTIGKFVSGSYFTGRAEQAGTLAIQALQKSNQATLALKQATRSQRLWTLGASVSDNVLYEIGLYGLLNDHAYMEDYDLSDFALGVGLGTAIVYPIKRAISRKAFSDAAGAMQISGISARPEIIARPSTILAKDYGRGTLLAKYFSDATAQEGLISGLSETENLDLLAKAERAQTASYGNAKVLMQDMMDEHLKTLDKAYKADKTEALKSSFVLPADRNPIPSEIIGSYISKNHGDPMLGVENFKANLENSPIYDTSENAFGLLYNKVDGDATIFNGAGYRQAMNDIDTTNFANKPFSIDDITIDSQGTHRLKVSGKIRNNINAFNTLQTYLAKNPTANIKVFGENITDLKSFINLGKANLQREFAQGELASVNHTFDEAYDLLPPGVKSQVAPVLLYWDGRVTQVDSVQAHLLQGAADKPNFTLDSRYAVETPKTAAKINLDSFTGSKYFKRQATELATFLAKRKAGIPLTGIESLKLEKNRIAITKAFGKVGSARLIKAASDTLAPVKSVFNPIMHPISITDPEFLNAQNAYASINKSAYKEKLFSVDPTDLPRLQAAYIHDYKVSGFSTREALLDHITKEKLSWVEKMTSAGFDDLQISKSVNLPIDTIEGMRLVGYHPDYFKPYVDADPKILFSYTKRAQEYLSTPQIRLSGLNYKVDQSAMTAADLDFRTVNDLVRSIAANVTETSKVDSFRTLYDNLIGTSTNRALEENIIQLYATAKAGNAYTSADHYFRGFDNLVGTITKAGNDFQVLTNEAIKNTLQPWRNALLELRKNTAAIVQFEQLRNALDSIPSSESKLLQWDKASRKIIKSITNPGKANQVTEYLRYLDSGNEIVIQSDELANMLDAWIPVQNYLYESEVTVNRLVNKPTSSPRGLWFPRKELASEFSAFRINTYNPADIIRISGSDLADINSKIASMREEIRSNPNLRIITRDKSLEQWNLYHSLSELEGLNEVNPSAFKRGIPNATITGSSDALQEVFQQAEQAILKYHRKYYRLANSNVFDVLSDLRSHHDGLYSSSRGSFIQKNQKGIDPATKAAKTMLNVSVAEEIPWFQSLNTVYSTLWDRGSLVLKQASHHIRDKVARGKGINQDDYNKLSAELTKQGIDGWKSFTDYYEQSIPKLQNVSKEHVSNISSVLTTFALRLADWSHAAVTVLSLPTLVATEATSMRAGNPMKYLMSGVKHLANPDSFWKSVQERGVSLGYTTRQTSEATQAIGGSITSRDFLRQLDDPTNDTTIAKAFRALTWGSDASEKVTRELAYLVGYEIAMKKFPNSAKEVYEEAANLFTSRAIGNYVARQRPVMFQGSLGQTIGLFQTFFWTVSQNMYRYIENKDLAAVMGFTAGYGATFGLNSMPLFNEFNTLVGAYVNDSDNTDIVQTVYKAFGNKFGDQSRSMGEFILYGLPSTLSQVGLYTRGDLEPRLPFQQGPQSIPLLYTLAQVYNTADNLVNQSLQLSGTPNPIMNITRAAVEGISVQSIWRPAARLAELVQGYSLDSSGQTVDPSIAFWEYPTLARVMGSRPLKETALRSLRYLHRYYDGKDYGNRRETIRAMRTALRGGESSSGLPSLMQNYMRNGGTPKGWNSVVNQAYLSEEEEYSDRLLREFSKQPGLTEIFSSYNY